MTFDLYLKTLILTVAATLIVIQVLGRTATRPPGTCAEPDRLCLLQAGTELISPLPEAAIMAGPDAPMRR